MSVQKEKLVVEMKISEIRESQVLGRNIETNLRKHMLDDFHSKEINTLDQCIQQIFSLGWEDGSVSKETCCQP